MASGEEPWTTEVAIKLRLGARARNCLWNEGIVTLADLTRLTPSRLMQIPNFGHRSLLEVTAALEMFGLNLSGEANQDRASQTRREIAAHRFLGGIISWDDMIKEGDTSP